MAKVRFKRINTASQIDNVPIQDGSFIVTGDGKSYIDYGLNRVPTNGTLDSEMSDDSLNGVENKVIKAYVDNVQDNVDSLDDAYGFEDSDISTTGTYSANWKVRKWNNGFCEMWGKASWSVNISQSYGYSIYALIQNVPLPITLTTNLIGVQINPLASSQIYYTTLQSYGTSKFSFFVAKPDTAQSGTQTIGFEFYIRGTWK